MAMADLLHDFLHYASYAKLRRPYKCISGFPWASHDSDTDGWKPRLAVASVPLM
jgi:hypothetical protein